MDMGTGISRMDSTPPDLALSLSLPSTSNATNPLLPLQGIINELQVLRNCCKTLSTHATNLSDWNHLRLITSILDKLKEYGFVSEAQCMEFVQKLSTITKMDKSKGIEGLIMMVYKASNTTEALKAFIEGVHAAGQTELAKELKLKCSEFNDPFQASSPESIQKKPNHCLLIPEVTMNVMQFLSASDLVNTRQVCTTWNSVGNVFVGEALQVTFTSHESVENFNKMDSEFCRSCKNFQFKTDDKKFKRDVREIYKTFFQKFGNQVSSIYFSQSEAQNLVAYVLGREIQKNLTQLTTLQLSSYINKSEVLNLDFEHIKNLRHVTITAYQGSSGHGQLELLNKLLESPCKIKSLKLRDHFCMGGGVTTALKKVVNYPHLEVLDIDSQTLCKQCQDALEHWAATTEFHLHHLRIATGSVVLPKTFYRFMKNSEETLMRLTLNEFHPKYLEVLPSLGSLKFLELKFSEDDQPVVNLNISFCDRLQRLQKLRLSNFKTFKDSSRSSFCNYTVKSLHLTCQVANSAIKDLLVSACFPNLTKLVIEDKMRVEISVRPLGFQVFLLNMPHIECLAGNTDLTISMDEVEPLKKLKDLVLEHCGRFRRVHVKEEQPPSSEIVCFLSKLHDPEGSYRVLRDEAKKIKRKFTYTIQVLDILVNVPTYFIDRKRR